MIDNQIVGFGDMSYGGELDRLYVHKDYQGKNIASAIAKRLEEDAVLVDYIGVCVIT